MSKDWRKFANQSDSINESNLFWPAYAKRLNRMTKKGFSPRKFLRQSKSLWSKKHRQNLFSVETIFPVAQSSNAKRHWRRRNQTQHKLRLRLSLELVLLMENFSKKRSQTCRVVNGSVCQSFCFLWAVTMFAEFFQSLEVAWQIKFATKSCDLKFKLFSNLLRGELRLRT